jgi:hypothetical protein
MLKCNWIGLYLAAVWDVFLKTAYLLRKEGHSLLWSVQFRLVAAPNLIISLLYGSSKPSSCGEASLYFCAGQRYPRVLPSVLVWYICRSPLDTLRRGPSFQKRQNDLPQNFWNWNHARQQKVKLCVAYIVIFFRKYLLGPVYHSLVIGCFSEGGRKNILYEICNVTGSAVHNAVFGLQSCLGWLQEAKFVRLNPYVIFGNCYWHLNEELRMNTRLYEWPIGKQIKEICMDIYFYYLFCRSLYVNK